MGALALFCNHFGCPSRGLIILLIGSEEAGILKQMHLGILIRHSSPLGSWETRSKTPPGKFKEKTLPCLITCGQHPRKKKLRILLHPGCKRIRNFFFGGVVRMLSDNTRTVRMLSDNILRDRSAHVLVSRDVRVARRLLSGQASQKLN